MAKRKNRKATPANRQNAKAANDKKAPIEAKEPVKAKINLQKSEPEQKPCAAREPMRVRLLTSLAGMFLTFVLGLYLGSLMPDAMQAINKETDIRQMPVQAPPAPAAQAPAPQTEVKAEKEEIPGQYVSQIRELEARISQNPQNVHLWVDLGNLYFDFNAPKAILAYKEALKLKPDNPDVLTDMGIMYREEHNYEKALECFREAVKFDARHANAMFNQGVVLAYDLRKKEEAIAIWQKLLETYPNFKTPDGKALSAIVRDMRGA